MSSTLILIVGGIYLIIAIGLFKEKKVGLAIAFLGYAFSNIGLYIATL